MTRRSMYPETIYAHASPTPDQLWAALRQIGMIVGAWAIGRGYLRADTASAVGAIALVIVPFILGQMKTRLRAQQLATVARSAHVPDSIASIKD